MNLINRFLFRFNLLFAFIQFQCYVLYIFHSNASELFWFQSLHNSTSDSIEMRSRNSIVCIEKQRGDSFVGLKRSAPKKYVQNKIERKCYEMIKRKMKNEKKKKKCLKSRTNFLTYFIIEEVFTLLKVTIFANTMKSYSILLSNSTHENVTT